MADVIPKGTVELGISMKWEKERKAVRENNRDILRGIRRKTWEGVDRDGWTLLTYSASLANLQALHIAVQSGADVDQSDRRGRTALHVAAGAGHVTCAMYLTLYGASLWVMDSSFSRPLDLAIRHGHHSLAHWLDQAASNQLVTRRRLFSRHDKTKKSTLNSIDQMMVDMKATEDRRDSVYGGMSYSSYSLTSHLSGLSIKSKLDRVVTADPFDRFLEGSSTSFYLADPHLPTAFDKQDLVASDGKISFQTSDNSTKDVRRNENDKNIASDINHGRSQDSSYKPYHAEKHYHKGDMMSTLSDADSYRSDATLTSSRSNKSHGGVAKKLQQRMKLGASDSKVPQYLKKPDNTFKQAVTKPSQNESYSNDSQAVKQIYYPKTEENMLVEGASSTSVFPRENSCDSVGQRDLGQPITGAAVNSANSVDEIETLSLNSSQNSQSFTEYDQSVAAGLDILDYIISREGRNLHSPRATENMDLKSDSLIGYQKNSEARGARKVEMDEIEEFMMSLGLSEYTAIFRNAHIDMQSLTMLADEDLKHLGIPSGLRGKILSELFRRYLTQANNNNNDGGNYFGSSIESTAM